MSGIRAINVKPVLRKYRLAEKNLSTTRLMAEIGSTAIALIAKRTKTGRQVSGKPFKKYTPAYRKWKEKHGYSGRVNLAVKGHMLAAMHSKVLSKSRALLHFIRGEESEKANWVQDIKGRDFFGLNKKDMGTITRKIIIPHIRKLARGVK